MKKLVFIFIILAACGTIFPSESYMLKVIKFHETYYAEWGMKGEEEYEDRYDGIECEIYFKGSLLGTITLVQHWFKKNRIPYPKIGECFAVEKFNHKSYYIPGDGYNIEFSKLKIISNKCPR